MDLKPQTLQKIMRDVIKLYFYKITTHQLLTLTEKLMKKRVELCKAITDMFDDEELDEKQIIFIGEAHFLLNVYVNKQNYWFQGKENPNVLIAVPLYLKKVFVSCDFIGNGIVKEIYLQSFEETVTGARYKELLEIKLFRYVKKLGLVKNFYFL